MKALSAIVVVLALALVCSSPASKAGDLQDSYGDRLAAAKRYFEVVRPQELMRDMVIQNANSVPDPDRSRYVQHLMQAVRMDVIENAMLASLARHLTVGEIDALTAFYKTSEGRSAMQKMGAYTADVMPVVIAELVRAQNAIKFEVQQPPN